MGQQKRAAMLALAAGLVVPRWALAQDTTRADETFHAGRELMKDGKLAEACPKFEESQRADPASGTLLALAYCQELSGLLASSHTNYLAAADLAAKEGQTEKQKAAADRATSLERRYSTVTVVVPATLGNLPGLKVLRDGIELERTAYNARLPLNGGMHSIEATAPGRVRWSGTVTLQPESDHKTLTLPLLAVEGDPNQPGADVEKPASAAQRASSANLWRRGSIALAIGGGIAVGLGATFGILAKSRNDASNADGHCDALGCDALGVERRQSALGAARASTWSFVAAGALGVGSVVLYLKSTSDQSTSVGTSLVQGAPNLLVTRTF